MSNKVTFGVMTDLHSEIIHDAEKRIRTFTQACAQNHVDFAVQLGDFVLPDCKGKYVCDEERVTQIMKNTLKTEEASFPRRRALLALLKNLEYPVYHVMGNHDLDFHSHQEFLTFYGMEKAYYSFEKNGFHFVVLDTNYGKKDGNVFPLDRGIYHNWMYTPDEPYPYIPEEELAWLNEDLKNTDKPVIVLSHSGLNQGFLNALNSKEVFDVLCETPGKVILCINGHKHQDLLEYERGIPVLAVNTISGPILHPKYATERFDKETEETYPNVRQMAVYKDPLFAIITVDDNQISIKGVQGDFVSPTPEELGVQYGHGNLTASIRSISIPRQK